MCQALNVNHLYQDTFGINPEGIRQISAVPCGQFDNGYELELLDDLNYGLPFDNDIGIISFDVSPSSTDTFDIFLDNTLQTHTDDNDVSDLMNLDFSVDSNANYHHRQSTDHTDLVLQRGVSLFEDHLQNLKTKFHCEDSFSNANIFDEIVTPDDLNDNDFQFILKDRHKRDQNNESSKRSRENRKLKFKQMKEECDMLEAENYHLKRKISKMDLFIDKCNQRLNEALKPNPKSH